MTPGRRRNRRLTPLRKALRDDSFLQAIVSDGLSAMPQAHRGFIDEALRTDFSDSLDSDAAFLDRNPDDNRWDYLLGHGRTGAVVGLEPHSAKEDQVSKVIAKRSDALVQLRPHLKPGAFVERWLWVASGEVHFADTEKTRRRLDQNGIQFVGRKVLAKHLRMAS